MRIFKFFLLGFCLSYFLLPAGEDEGFAYLQTLREKANMLVFKRDNLLDKASYNHANYLKINDTSGHIEDASKPGFTGEKPSDRAKNVGLFSKNIGENVSTGQQNFKDSVDDLFTAIYHRLGFLDVTFDRVGLSNEGTKYSYLMSNSLLEDACKNKPSDNRGQLICANEKAFEDDTVNKLKKQTADKNPQFIIWPPNNSDDNPPYFYDEYPDPLPNHEVSGNPISITFNEYYHSSPPSLKTFKLLDSNNQEIKTIFRAKSNAIHKGFLDEYSFVLFPDERLNWNSTYKIEYDFSSLKGNIKGISTFKTRKLGEKTYYVKKANATLKVINNQEYTIDLIPLNSNDNSLGKGYGSGGTATEAGFKVLSLNTFKVTLKGSIGGYLEYRFGGDLRSVRLIISNSDDIENDDTSDDVGNDDNAGEKKEISYTRGWNLKSLLDTTTINNTKDYLKDFNVLYTYDGSKFIFNPSKIEYKNAYFVYYNKATKNNVPFKESDIYEISINTLKENVWNLVPVGKKIDSAFKYFKSEKIFILKNSQYERPLNIIERGEAVWVKK